MYIIRLYLGKACKKTKQKKKKKGTNIEQQARKDLDDEFGLFSKQFEEFIMNKN